MIVLKFGGASLADAKNFTNVTSYIRKSLAQKLEPVVVVSAMWGVTDLLLETIDEAVKGHQKKVAKNLEFLKKKHQKIIAKLIKSSKIKNQALDYLNKKISELESLFHSIAVLKEATPKSQDYIVSFGEKLAANLLASILSAQKIRAKPVNGEEIIITDSNFGHAYPDFKITRQKVKRILIELLKKKTLPIVTGFIGANKKSETTTLGRGGSDFTASILAYILNAQEVWYLKEVSGIMTADPKLVTKVKAIKKMSYEEVAELSYFGAKIIHPIAIWPLKKKQIPSFIKNVYKFTSKGTEITSNKVYNGRSARAITSIENVIIITVQGKGMAGIPGMAKRVFSSVAKVKINVLMISQSSSEQNICFVTRKEDKNKATRALEKEFELELLTKKIEKIIVEDDVSVVSLVGAGMKNTPGIAGKLFSALGKNQINIKLIAQGSSELNISFIVATKDLKQTVNYIHQEFHLANKGKINLIQFGVGKIGFELLKQVYQLKNKRLKYIVLSNSKGAIIDPKGIKIKKILTAKGKDKLSAFKSFKKGLNNLQIVKQLQEQKIKNCVLIDVTASDKTFNSLIEGLRAGFNVVMSNKKAIASSWAKFNKLIKTARLKGKDLFFECAVGAGLPVIYTLNSLFKSGDKIKQIDGCFSGTLGYILSQLEKGKPFSQIVSQAKKLGYTEPDPRNDLSGLDVARKALILARILGYKLNIRDVKVENLVPPELQKCSVDKFLTKISNYNKKFAQRSKQAKEQGRVLRYVASIRKNKIRVGIKKVASNSAIGSLKGPENICLIYTDKYRSLPLVIRGPGAGIKVTASGVLRNILECN